MNYLSIGTNTLNKDLFLDIKNTDKIKSCGGLWATEYEYQTYNPWVDYLCEHPHLLFYKNYGYPNLPAVYLTLEENAKIFNVSTEEDVNYLKRQYPYNNWIDFEKLSKDFDGIYIDIQKLRNIELTRVYSVNTLILFNLNCVKYYQEAEVVIEYLDVENPVEGYGYKINISEEKKKIPELSLEYMELFQKVKEYLMKNNKGRKEELIEEFIKQNMRETEFPRKDLLIRKLVMSI